LLPPVLETPAVRRANPAVTSPYGRTRARGDITVVRNFENKGRSCRELRVRNEVPGRKGDTRLSFCQVDGKWRLLSAQQMK